MHLLKENILPQHNKKINRTIYFKKTTTKKRSFPFNKDKTNNCTVLVRKHQECPGRLCVFQKAKCEFEGSEICFNPKYLKWYGLNLDLEYTIQVCRGERVGDSKTSMLITQPMKR